MLPVENPPRFQDELHSIAAELERWRKEQALVDAKDDAEPQMNWRLAGIALALWVTGWLATTAIIPLGRMDYVFAAMAAYTLSLALLGISFFLLLRAMGIMEVQFWRALFNTFHFKDADAFPVLKLRLTRDFAATSKLGGYSTHALKSSEEFLQLEEAERRERVNSVLGNSSLTVIVGLGTAAFASVKSLVGSFNSINIAAFLSAIVLLSLGILSARIRVSLVELTRSRQLIRLELARRKHANEGD